ncbi:hypothetical protein T552_00951 [Pneumocystis carinii B80]|uniref:Mitochondrial import protein 1 n=1 Tax=Pneumocystis carinii (strain B80) TaxID=1408658 RepID=A0A0W4ZMZ7_PNEC8|nr:hypothetical protein T552_00951 [Pneumocystis carinii B80]KTW29744.1 hypothetical protein T552_00951 [Pneumocystis carinii B80]
MNENQLIYNSDMSSYELSEDNSMSEESEKDDVIDVLHVYPTQDDNEKSLKKNNMNRLIPYVNNESYKKVWTLIRSSVINMFLPFINGVFLGFGEIFAHEISIRWNILGARQRPHRLNKNV